MQEKVKLFARDDGLVFPVPGNFTGSIQLDFTSCEKSGCALQIESSIDNETLPFRCFSDISEASNYRNFRSDMTSLGTIKLFVNDKAQHKQLYNVNLFYLGNGLIVIAAGQEITIKLDRANKTAPYSYLPTEISTRIEQIVDVEPEDLEQLESIKSESILVREMLLGLNNRPITEQLKHEIQHRLIVIRSQLTKLEAIKRRLKQLPSFEATRKTILIEKLKNHLESQGLSSLFQQFATEALKEANDSIGSDEPFELKLRKLKEELKEHALNGAIESYLHHDVPPQICIYDCAECGEHGQLHKSDHPKTQKHRWHVQCVNGHRLTNLYDPRAAQAVVNWNRKNVPSQITFDNFELPIDSSMSHFEILNFVKGMKQYAMRYKHYLTQAIRHLDETEVNEYKKILGKVNHLVITLDLIQFLSKERFKKLNF